MQIEQTPISNLKIIHPHVFSDDRGFFFESYNAQKFNQLGIDTLWVQDNQARSQKHTLRGLHFQLGKGQAKLVRCTRGLVWDVAVDIRLDSPTLGQWFGLELSDENKKMLFIPEGFAHGYCVLSDEAEVVYKCSTVYNKELETEVKWDDPELKVKWPVTDPILSLRDINAQSFRDYLNGLQDKS